VPRYYEDFVEGSVETYGPKLVTREEIVAFAAEFDPQPMHLDENAARKTMMGGLVASGWHTCMIMMRLFTDGMLLDSSSMGAPGVEELRWLKPVRPGDKLSARLTVLDKRVSKSRPDIGFVRLQIELVNQNNEVVILETHPHMFGRRAMEKRA
jgi:acyl dehydratase